jgi:hypothetical protein
MEVPNQIAAIRKAPGEDGFIIWPLDRFLNDSPLTNRLRSNEFAQAALVPPFPWLDNKPPMKPAAKLIGRGDNASVTITRPNVGKNDDVFVYAIQAKFKDTWRFAVVPATVEKIPTEGATVIAISAVDRLGNASERVIVKVPGAKGLGPTTAPTSAAMSR